MRTLIHSLSWPTQIAALVLMAAAIIWTSAFAQNAPSAMVASPDVYKIIKENDDVRLIMSVWKPGQRDKWHSHPHLLSYFLTGCKLRIHFPGGKTSDHNPPQGLVGKQAPVKSHSFENTGDTECRILIVESK